MKYKILSAAAIITAALAAAPAAAGPVYDFAGDFGNSVFSYGYGVTGTTFNPFTNGAASGCFGVAALACQTSAANGQLELPGVAINTGTTPAEFYTNTVPHGTLFIQSGNASDQDAILNFTAPTAGDYNLNALIGRVDSTSNGDGVTVSAFVNGILFRSAVLPATPGSSTLFAGNFTLAQNDKLTIGVNRNTDYSYDGTGITGTIGAVPEPATWAMMLMGFGMIGFGLRYRRKEATRVAFA